MLMLATNRSGTITVAHFFELLRKDYLWPAGKAPEQIALVRHKRGLGVIGVKEDTVIKPQVRALLQQETRYLVFWGDQFPCLENEFKIILDRAFPGASHDALLMKMCGPDLTIARKD